MAGNIFKKLPPKIRQYATLGGVSAAILGVVYLGVSSQESGQAVRNDNVIKNVLTDKNTREITIDNMAADMRRMVKENTRLRRELDALRDEVDRKDYNAGVKIDPEVLRTQINNLTRQLNQQKERIIQLEGRKPQVYSSGNRYFSDLPESENTEHGSVSETAPSYDKSSVPAVMTPDNSGEAGTVIDVLPANEKKSSEAVMPVYSVVFNKTPASAPEKKSEVQKTGYSIYLPAGTIISGVLLNGLDAPTGQQARKEPFPAVVRIQKDAVLPNQYTSDIRECFLIVSGFGDLSSERAYLRGETVSCIDRKKNFIEGLLNAYAVGEDGKAGIRGRLVSKQGQIIAKSMMAGFLSGLSDVFDVNAVPTINTSTSGKVSYEHVYSAGALQGAAAKGISSSLSRISDFYIKMAEGLYPVIEIDAGRTIDLVVSKGSVLSVRGEETPVTRKNSTGSRGTEGSEKSKITDNWIK